MTKLRNFATEKQKMNSDFGDFFNEIKEIIRATGLIIPSEPEKNGGVINYVKMEFYIPVKKYDTDIYNREIVFSGTKLSVVTRNKKSASLQYLDEPKDWRTTKIWRTISSFKKDLKKNFYLRYEKGMKFLAAQDEKETQMMINSTKKK